MSKAQPLSRVEIHAVCAEVRKHKRAVAHDKALGLVTYIADLEQALLLYAPQPITKTKRGRTRGSTTTEVATGGNG